MNNDREQISAEVNESSPQEEKAQGEWKRKIDSARGEAESDTCSEGAGRLLPPTKVVESVLDRAIDGG